MSAASGRPGLRLLALGLAFASAITCAAAGFFLGCDDLLSLPGIERLHLLVVNRNRHDRLARSLKNMMRSANSDQLIAGGLKPPADLRKANGTGHSEAYPVLYEIAKI